jgi:DNA-binding NtrC family response regulator
MSKSGSHILVVDDEIEIVRALRRSLIAHGYKVFTASINTDTSDAAKRDLGARDACQGAQSPRVCGTVTPED